MNERRITAYNDQGREVASYPSLAAAARDRHVPEADLAAAAEAGAPCAGRHWAFADAERPAALPETGYVAYDATGAAVARYATVKAAAEALGVATGSVKQAARAGYRIGALGLRVRRAQDGAPAAQNGRGVEALDATGAVQGRYASQVDAAKACGVTAPAIFKALKTGGRCAGLSWRYAQAEGAQAPQAAPDAERAVTAYDDRGQEVATYPTLTGAAQERGLRPQGVWGALKSGGRCGGLRWRRAGESAPAPAPVPAEPEAKPKRGYATVDACGKRTEYATLEAVGAALGVTRQAVLIRIQRGTVVGGLRVEGTTRQG